MWCHIVVFMLHSAVYRVGRREIFMYKRHIFSICKLFSLQRSGCKKCWLTTHWTCRHIQHQFFLLLTQMATQRVIGLLVRNIECSVFGKRRWSSPNPGYCINSMFSRVQGLIHDTIFFAVEFCIVPFLDRIILYSSCTSFRVIVSNTPVWTGKRASAVIFIALFMHDIKLQVEKIQARAYEFALRIHKVQYPAYQVVVGSDVISVAF